MLSLFGNATLRGLLFLSLIAALACGDDDAAGDGGTDAGTDAQVDAPERTGIEALEVDETRALEGLSGEVHAVQDSRGMWHIYAENELDGIRAQGYLQARDRLGQMEFVRRQAVGTLAAFGGALDDSLIDRDINARFEGHARNAQAIFDSLSGEEQTFLETFAAGINEHIADIRAEEVFFPSVIATVIPPEIVSDWTPIETLAIARLQAAALSFDAREDLRRTNRVRAFQEVFAADSEDPRRARLAGAFYDLYPIRPAQDAFNIDGFPNIGDDSGTRAHIIPPSLPFSAAQALPTESLAAAAAFLERSEAGHVALFGDGFRGSNSWAVSGNVTESGNPIMANDPHLALTSPPLFWMAHLNTKRAGGDIDAAGQMIAGTPVSILGFTDQIAWGLTTSGYDVSDVYLELITPGEGAGTVEFEGGQIAITEENEVIEISNGTTQEVTFQRVPHHGLIIPGSRVACEEDSAPPCEAGKEIALSIAWEGNTPSNEAGAFLSLYRANNIEEARDAFRQFEVGGQTLVAIDREGGVFYTSSVRIPVREAGALTYDPLTHEGATPCMILDGRGGMEWTGEHVDERFIPHAFNPETYIATANADPVGVTADGNALNGVDPEDPADDIFLGCSFANGHRQGRIAERLDALTAAGDVTVEQMSELQNDAVSPYGRTLTPMFLEQLERVMEERETAGTHADLEAAVAAMDEATFAKLMDARSRLMAWTSFDTPAAVEGNPSDEEIADSVATSIFNVTMGHLARLVFDDEYSALGEGRSNAAGRTLVNLVTRPETLHTFDAELGDSVLFDDISTEAVESRGERVLQALLLALAELEADHGADPIEWRWGKLHTLRLDAIVPARIFGNDPLSIPSPSDETFPNGFPRHGDRDVVDASNFGVFNTSALDYGSGPQQRLVVEMTPDGPRAVNALPGGNSEDPGNPHHRDEMERWRNNEVSNVPFTEEEVIEAAETHIVFTPNG